MSMKTETSTSKHTAGPWAIGCGKFGVPTITTADAPITQAINGRRHIAQIDGKNQEANARLIASAPELLEALRECLAVVAIQNGNLHEDTNKIQEMARAAIEKATGGAR